MDKAYAQLAEPLVTKSVSTTLGSASNAARELYANSHHRLLLHADFLKFHEASWDQNGFLYDALAVRYSKHQRTDVYPSSRV